MTSNFPALSGLGISIVRVEVGVKGSYPMQYMHTHYDATELLIVDEQVSETTIRDGDVIVFTKGLM